MANVNRNFLLVLVCCLLSLVYAVIPNIVQRTEVNNHISWMQQEISMDSVHNIKKRSLRDQVRNARAAAEDEKCYQQNKHITDRTDLLNATNNNFIHKYTFPNESKYSIALVWAGANTGKIIVAVTEEHMGMFPGSELYAKASTLYLSSDEGKFFTNITNRLSSEQVYIRRNNGVQKNPKVANQIFIICHGDNVGETKLFVTTNGADSFQKSVMPFTFTGNLVFHPSKQEFLLAHDYSSMSLYQSTDNGVSWKQIKKNVVNFRWKTWEGDPEDTVYVAVDDDMTVILGTVFPSSSSQLEKSTDGGLNWEVVHKTMLTFGLQGKFIYVSVATDKEDERYMEVSTDGGKSWNEVQLPSITDERFYAILDMSEEQVFMHVDDPGDTGAGTIFTSDSLGIIFSESLKNHLYPNHEDLTDFYKVESMRGVYIGSQLADDQSIHTMITRDRGGVWFPIQRPEGLPCQDETKACYLQIHNKYSADRGIRALPPLSTESAVGIILIHGHIASSLQTTDPDVFVSDDGGYQWRRTLQGPHHYQIADQGGLIVAVAANAAFNCPKEVKFSTDEGHCWHTYTFTKEDIVFTGLLTEPGNKAMSVAIWGYGREDRIWRSHVIDFEKIIDNKCMESDYQTWSPHTDGTNDGCLLGRKETFQRLKPDSLCLNGHTRQIAASGTEKQCPCNKADFECDYGYSRAVGSEECVKDDSFKNDVFDICLRGDVEEYVFLGYRKLPGDICKEGFKPPQDTVIDLKKHCKDGDGIGFVAKEEGVALPNEGHAHRAKVGILVTVALVVFLSVIILIAYLVKKYRDLKQSKLVYRYSMIKTEEERDHDELERALSTHTSLYEDSSDEEQPINSRGSNRPLGNGSLSVQASSIPSLSASSGSKSVEVHVPNGSMRDSGRGSIHGSMATTPRSTHSVAPPHKPAVRSYHDDSDEDMLE